MEDIANANDKILYEKNTTGSLNHSTVLGDSQVEFGTHFRLVVQLEYDIIDTSVKLVAYNCNYLFDKY